MCDSVFKTGQSREGDLAAEMQFQVGCNLTAAMTLFARDGQVLAEQYRAHAAQCCPGSTPALTEDATVSRALFYRCASMYADREAWQATVTPLATMFLERARARVAELGVSRAAVGPADLLAGLQADLDAEFGEDANAAAYEEDDEDNEEDDEGNEEDDEDNGEDDEDKGEDDEDNEDEDNEDEDEDDIEDPLDALLQIECMPGDARCVCSLCSAVDETWRTRDSFQTDDTVQGMFLAALRHTIASEMIS
jgi:hypothetical protein